MSARLPERTREGLDEAGKAVWDRIASGARGGVGGPFLALLAFQLNTFGVTPPDDRVPIPWR